MCHLYVKQQTRGYKVNGFMINSNKLINNLEGLVTSGLWPDMACGLPVALQCMQLKTRRNQRIDQLISKQSTVSRELFSGQPDLKRVLSSSSVSCGDWVCWPVPRHNDNCNQHTFVKISCLHYYGFRCSV
jgi:hypothetical protein